MWVVWVYVLKIPMPAFSHEIFSSDWNALLSNSAISEKVGEKVQKQVSVEEFKDIWLSPRMVLNQGIKYFLFPAL